MVELRISLGRARRRQRDRLDLGQIELAGSAIDVEADDVAVGVKIDDQPLDNLSGLGAGRVGQFDVEAVGLGIVVQLHR